MYLNVIDDVCGELTLKRIIKMTCIRQDTSFNTDMTDNNKLFATEVYTERIFRHQSHLIQQTRDTYRIFPFTTHLFFRV